MEREIIVSGSAEVRIPPDRALVTVTVDADGGSRDDAYRAAARTAGDVDAVVAQHDAEIERVVTAALTVQPLTRYRRGEVVRTGWRASRRSVIEVVDFTGLGVLLAELAGASATIDGPTWVVDTANPAYDEVRRAAAADARRRAEAYASGLGVALGPINWVAEPGLRSSGAVPMARAMFASAPQGMARGGGPDEEPVIEITPADADIEAAIEVSFALAPSA